MQKLKDDTSLIPRAIDEMLRYESPVQRGFRLVAKDTEVDGKPIRREELLILLIGAANRDPEYFPDPDRFDVTRKGHPHLTFGSGIHFCLGAPLATLEAAIAFETLLRRFPEMKLETRRPQWTDASMLRRLKSLPVALRSGSRQSGSEAVVDLTGNLDG
jgi:cytochrome P450